MSYKALNSEKQKIMDDLQKLLDDFANSQSEIGGQMIFSYPESVPLADTWKGDVDPILVGAICSAVKITFQHLCQNLKKGNLMSLTVLSENGKSLIQNAGQKAILTTILDYDVDINRVAFITSDLSKKIERLMENF